MRKPPTQQSPTGGSTLGPFGVNLKLFHGKMSVYLSAGRERVPGEGPAGSAQEEAARRGDHPARSWDRRRSGDLAHPRAWRLLRRSRTKTSGDQTRLLFSTRPGAKALAPSTKPVASDRKPECRPRPRDQVDPHDRRWRAGRGQRQDARLYLTETRTATRALAQACQCVTETRASPVPRRRRLPPRSGC